MRTLVAFSLCLALLGISQLESAEARSDKSAKSGKSGKSHRRSRKRRKSRKSGKSDRSSDKSGKSDRSSDKSGKSSGSSGKSGKSGPSAPPPPPVNQPPVAKDSNGRFHGVGTTVVPAPGLIGNASDPDGDAITVIAVQSPSTIGATVSWAPDGSFGYNATSVPAVQALGPGETIVDTFTFTISDGRGGMDTATVTITVFR